MVEQGKEQKVEANISNECSEHCLFLLPDEMMSKVQTTSHDLHQRSSLHVQWQCPRSGKIQGETAIQDKLHLEL